MVLNASLVLAIAAVASRVLGWVRLVVIGSQFGASRELDAYFAAFLIPDAIFQLLIAGALFTALVPVFVSLRTRDQEIEAWRLASSVINALVLALAALSLVVALF
ncbi:MAG TPA: lipid II flippase MurJ, partial [Candidatus Limnocylindrales bacterium]